MNLLRYDQMSLELLWHTPAPKRILKLACDITMKNSPYYGGEITPELLQHTMKNSPHYGREVTPELLQYIIDADHTKVLEHVCCGFMLRWGSRSLLQQLITHRTWSATSASQHYQDYSDMPMVVDPIHWQDPDDDIFARMAKAYEDAIARGVPKEEARQVLGNASAVNMLITTNYRCLLNFFSLRLCYRNVYEMRVFANKLRELLTLQFPLFFDIAGPQCYMDKCKQGRMRCAKKEWTPGVI